MSKFGSLLRLAAYLAAAMVAGALLAPPVHVALGTAGVEFDSVLRRVVTLAALVLLPLYVAGSGMSRRGIFGLSCSRRMFVRTFVAGLGLGVIAAAVPIAAFVALGVRAPVDDSAGAALPAATAGAAVTARIAAAAAAALAALAAAVLIGIVEEAYFRGALLAPLRGLPASAAVTVVAIVYAAVHFAGGPVAADPGPFAGLTSLARSEFRTDGFLALLAAGVLLGALRCRFGHIGPGAGFHAGWVWLMKLNQEYTDAVPGSDLAFLAGSHGGTMGWLGFAWIGLIGAGWLAARGAAHARKRVANLPATRRRRHATATPRRRPPR